MRGLMSTNYDIQSLDDMKNDLLDWEANLQTDIANAENIIETLNKTIWKNISEWDIFRVCATKCFKFFQTSLNEIKQVNNEINKTIKINHVNILRHIGDVGADLYKEIGLAKHQGDRGYIDNAEMELYCILRDRAYDLIDLQQLSIRLKDFIGDITMTKETNWGKIGTIATIIGAIATIIGLFAYQIKTHNINNTENIIKNNTINAEQLILNNNGTVNKINTETNNK